MHSSAPPLTGKPTGNGIENLVAADVRCNNDKRDFVASTEHLQRWRAAHFDADGQPVNALEQISGTISSWPRRPTHWPPRADTACGPTLLSRAPESVPALEPDVPGAQRWVETMTAPLFVFRAP